LKPDTVFILINPQCQILGGGYNRGAAEDWAAELGPDIGVFEWNAGCKDFVGPRPPAPVVKAPAPTWTAEDQQEFDAGVLRERQRVMTIIKRLGINAVSKEAIRRGVDMQNGGFDASAVDDRPAADEPQDFMEAVKLAFRQGAPGPRAAIKKAALAWPELYQAHLQALGHQGGYGDILADSPAPSEDFEGQVARIMASGKRRVEAIKAAARDFPELHAAYIQRQQRGE
jgi:hypothetical protein